MSADLQAFLFYSFLNPDLYKFSSSNYTHYQLISTRLFIIGECVEEDIKGGAEDPL
jgi:Sec-independent protein secretion pathway component TatC